jgi:hypothetical protein
MLRIKHLQLHMGEPEGVKNSDGDATHHQRLGRLAGEDYRVAKPARVVRSARKEESRIQAAFID